PVRTLTITPSLPPSLERLRELAYNVRWAWDENTVDLFRRLGADLWHSSGHNPVKMLAQTSATRLEELAEDEGFVAHLNEVCASFDAYMQEDSTWYSRAHKNDKLLAAYFSAEFGVTECMSLFAGGLGVLAGDHLKSASDLGVPIVGVGLMYQQGYFIQSLDENGWQQESYRENDFTSLPSTLERDANGTPLQVHAEIGGRRVYARIWRLQVGRVPLYLLDTNFDANEHSEDRNLTDYLYGGGNELRIRQEIILGIGGYRALQLLNLRPQVYHLNEGHSAFLTLEHTRKLMVDHHLPFNEASVAAAANVVFTTHTPVEAGHDRFPPELMDRYLVSYAKDALGLDRREFLALGREHPDNGNEFFGMTKLALRMSDACNGVAKLHGDVSRAMWHNLWPALPENEVPISHVTNAIHTSSWISGAMKEHLDRYVGPQWREKAISLSQWKQAEQIPDEILWQTHVIQREQLVQQARKSLQSRLHRLGASTKEIDRAAKILDPNTLTIGFARRFATYKRATLLLQDYDRLVRILTNGSQPVQIIFAGKAHPRDHPGKELIQQIVDASNTESLRNHIVFLEDYDMAIARYLVQGVDLWLNTPRRPREASGTSGMKAAANGGLNLSILDGWWEEGYDPSIGWAIGNGEVLDNHAYQDEREAAQLYDQLEHEIVPLFYDRSPEGLPREWIARMKHSIATYNNSFNTHRMVQEYTERIYLTAAARAKALQSEDLARARVLSKWQQKIQEAWQRVQVSVTDDSPQGSQKMGLPFTIRACVKLGDLLPDDVEVQLYLGRVTAKGEIMDATIIPMVLAEVEDGTSHLYEATNVTCTSSGSAGYTVRVLPKHQDQVSMQRSGLVAWAQ
ncbi:MAG: glycosyltransferase family 1 protein, partial [Rhodothermaceae bacterium]|nr:glycosyltransferase family 1 protein [Rhodothermaceae bacterium]